MTSQVVVHPLESVTVTVCSPTLRPMAFTVVSPLSHKYVYPPFPPRGVTVACPSLSPLAETAMF